MASGVSLVDSLDALAELGPAWDRLGGRASPPMQHAAWARACAATLTGTAHRLHVLTAGRTRLHAIVPLVKRAGPCQRLEQLEGCGFGELTDFLFASPDALDPVADVIARSGRPLTLARIPEDSPILLALRRAYRGRGVVVVRRAAPSPWIPLDATWTTPETHVSARRRSDLRRARRHAEARGPVQAEIIAPSIGELPWLLDEALDVEAAGWKGDAGTAMVADPVLAAFIGEYARAAASRGELRLCFLRLGGKAVAMQIAIETAGAFWLLKIAFNAEFGRCSPGTLLMVETIRYAAARGLARYELLGAVEPWTLVWTEQARPAVSLRAYPATVHGLTALTQDARATWQRARARAERP